MVTDTVLLLLFVVPEFIVLFILGLDIFEAHILTASFMIGGPKPPTTTSGKEKFWYFFWLDHSHHPFNEGVWHPSFSFSFKTSCDVTFLDIFSSRTTTQNSQFLTLEEDSNLLTTRHSLLCWSVKRDERKASLRLFLTLKSSSSQTKKVIISEAPFPSFGELKFLRSCNDSWTEEPKIVSNRAICRLGSLDNFYNCLETNNSLTVFCFFAKNRWKNFWEITWKF